MNFLLGMYFAVGLYFAHDFFTDIGKQIEEERAKSIPQHPMEDPLHILFTIALVPLWFPIFVFAFLFLRKTSP